LILEGDWKGDGLGFFVMPHGRGLKEAASQTTGNTPYISDWLYPAKL